ncbi:MAG: HAD family hydrolase [Acidimicrobiia bacterium]
MTPTTVVFDLGGVLIDWDPNYLYESLIPDQDQRERFLTAVCSPEWNHAMDAGASVPDSVAALAAQHPEDAALINAWWTRWPEMLAGAITDTVSLAEELSESGVRLLALTNWAAETWPHAIARFSFLTTLFDGIVVSGQEKTAKPGEELFNILIERYGLNPTATAFIDDSPANVAAAEALGFRSHPYTGTDDLAAWLGTLGLTEAR